MRHIMNEVSKTTLGVIFCGQRLNHTQLQLSPLPCHSRAHWVSLSRPWLLFVRSTWASATGWAHGPGRHSPQLILNAHWRILQGISIHIIIYTTHVVWLAFFPRKSLKMRRSATTWLAKDHWPFVACPSFPWRWSDCFSLRGWWLSFPLISSVSSSPITQTPTYGGNEAEDTGYLDSYWRILWLKFQKSETWSDFWNMKHVLIAL